MQNIKCLTLKPPGGGPSDSPLPLSFIYTEGETLKTLKKTKTNPDTKLKGTTAKVESMEQQVLEQNSCIIFGKKIITSKMKTTNSS